MESDKLILDACCGSRMFWFDKYNPLALFQKHLQLRTKIESEL